MSRLHSIGPATSKMSRSGKIKYLAQTGDDPTHSSAASAVIGPGQLPLTSLGDPGIAAKWTLYQPSLTEVTARTLDTKSYNTIELWKYAMASRDAMVAALESMGASCACALRPYTGRAAPSTSA